MGGGNTGRDKDGKRMNLKEKAEYISRKLDELYPVYEIPLRHNSVYELLVAVILSAQCTDKRVNVITPKLFAEANTPEKMVRLGRERIEEIIRSCGLSQSKSRSVYQTSKILVEEYGGEVPKDWKALESLPGVGHKTASVVMSQGFGVPAFPVDTHIHRLAARWGLSSGKNVTQTEKDLKKLYPEKEWYRLHLQIIYYGREYCPARGHDIEKCPICGYLAKNEQQEDIQ
jgi:endonuclease-3